MDALPAGLDPRLRARAEAGAAWVLGQRAAGRTVTVVHHIDADGVASGAIAAEALARAQVPFLLQPVKSLDAYHVERVQGLAPEALWFCDLGSTAYMHFPALPRLVCDHHQLVRDGSEESFAHVNPLLDGLSGEEISGAGCAYLVAAALDPANIALLPLALVGATGDLQDRKLGRFTGSNAALLALGKEIGLLEQRTDLAWFGTETRPLRKFLHLASGPEVPGISRDGRSAERLLAAWGVELEGDAKGWTGLSEDARRTVRSRIVEHLIDCGLARRVGQLFREVVTIRAEAVGSPTRELQEFGTLLNGTARYDRPEVGLAVARGDRGAAYQEALSLLLDHRRHLAGALDAFAQAGVQERAAVQWVHLQDRVRDTVVGIVCGMALDGLGLRRDMAVVGFAWTPDGRTKVSARAPHELQGRGIDLATALREAAAAVGGQGGGHKGAAGATIPRQSEDTFLLHLDALVAAQVGVAVVPPC
ncbi:MAG: DHHA1 domain-containing protein [Thermoplasmatota archaeon]|nr:DHH family phosphoesterase [Halobacteriales archaeon]